MTERCPTCGLEVDRISPSDAAVALRSFARRWRSALAVADDDDPDAVVRRRPGPSSWSALEHAGFVADVLGSAREQVERALVADRPSFPALPDPEERVRSGGFNDRDPAAVLDALATGSANLADTVAGVGHDGWGRLVVAGDAERSTLWLVRDAVHQGSHHLRDAQRALKDVRGRG